MSGTSFALGIEWGNCRHDRFHPPASTGAGLGGDRSDRCPSPGPGERSSLWNPGRRGWGNPLARPLSAVEQDIAEGLVSESVAATAYGLVFSDGHIDAAASSRLRAELQRRSPAPPISSILARNGRPMRRSGAMTSMPRSTPRLSGWLRRCATSFAVNSSRLSAKMVRRPMGRLPRASTARASP